MTKRNYQRAQKRQAKNNEKWALLQKTKQWAKLQMYGDVKILAELTGKSIVTISNALSGKKGSVELLRQIDEYFEKRAPHKPNTEHP